MNTARSSIRCAGCGWVAAATEAYPFKCPNANGDDVDHILVRVLDTTTLRFPDGGEPDPFARYRSLMHSYHLATDAGLDDDEYVQLIAALERSVAAVDSRGFRVTPMHRNTLLSDRLGFSESGGVWVKDETGNVSGSHKGRHLMGLLIHLEVAERLGLTAGRPLHAGHRQLRERGPRRGRRGQGRRAAASGVRPGRRGCRHRGPAAPAGQRRRGLPA